MQSGNVFIKPNNVTEMAVDPYIFLMKITHFDTDRCKEYTYYQPWLPAMSFHSHYRSTSVYFPCTETKVHQKLEKYENKNV